MMQEDKTYPHICKSCLTWMQILKPNISEDKFTKRNPLLYFWVSALDDYIFDTIKIENKDDEKYLNNIFNFVD